MTAASWSVSPTDVSPTGPGPAPPPQASHSYNNLETMVQDTVAMARAAVAGSPLRDRVVPSVWPSRSGMDEDEELSEALRYNHTHRLW